VIVDRPVKADLFDEVTFDNEGAMFDAARRLIALGHRRILFIVRQPNLVTTRQRIAGLRKAAAQCPEPAVAEVCEAGADEVALTARLAAEFRKPDPPTAIVASNSANAAWLLRALKLLGIRQPQDVSVLAFDEPEWADLVEPGLSVVRQPTREIARAAWELLVGRMSDRDLPIRHLELKAETVIRGSVAPLLRRREPAGAVPIAAAKPAAAAARTERRAARGERVREA
jgi:LacI family transcriptional regulator